MKIERIQKQALRYVFNDHSSSYYVLRSKAQRPIMYVQRLRSILTEVYKCINKLGPRYLHEMFILKDANYESWNILKLYQHKFKYISYGYTCIRYQGSKLWNSLDNELKSACTLKIFKHKLMQWEPDQCNCSTCTLCSLTNM